LATTTMTCSLLQPPRLRDQGINNLMDLLTKELEEDMDML
jgi:hypothetical protein